ncbi:uncharacterized protein CLUP02_09131 [Colletotrichum lupini]|uniref:Uncharacterized protein n=1 Tax=Colletotrichum lupini TaxID=145971 RepID=A0A9Q8SVN2_9PEZI|nr:uncharacterized protein CLUP02_09131 [Colletotrichum lupini]UQC83636.1 hypothetical protein CLUP02_09131 [Colletotrichum lupini]
MKTLFSFLCTACRKVHLKFRGCGYDPYGDNICVKERNKRPEVIAEPTVSIRLLSKARVPAIAKGNLGVEKAHLAGPNRARTPGRAHPVPIFPTPEFQRQLQEAASALVFVQSAAVSGSRVNRLSTHAFR